MTDDHETPESPVTGSPGTDEPNANAPGRANATDAIDAVLDERIRAGLVAMADEAPEPPDVFGGATPVGRAPAPVHQFRRPATLVAVAAAVVLLVAVAIVVTRPDDPDTLRAGTTTTAESTTSTTSTTIPDRSLYGTHWVLVSAEQDGKPLEIPGPERPATVTFDDHFNCPGTPGNCSPPTGAAYFYSTGCNGGSGSMRVEGNRLFPKGTGVETLVGCSLEVRPFARGDGYGKETDSSTYEIDGDTLVLRNPGGRVLTYRANDETLPKLKGTVLVEDHEGTVDYRVSWRAVDDDHYAMAFDRGNSGGTNDAAGIGGNANEPAVQVKKAHIYNRDLVYGIVPSAATKAIYVPSKSDAIELPLRRMDGGPYKGIATMVPPGDQKWTVIATDASGQEVGRMTTDYTGQTIDPFPPPTGEELVRGHHKLGQYRLSWERSGTEVELTLDRAQATYVLPSVSVAADPLKSHDVVADIGHLSLESIIFGLAPGEGERATVERVGGSEGPFAVELVPIPGAGDLKAFHGVVPWTSDTWDVTVYDSDGGIVGTFHHEGD